MSSKLESVIWLRDTGHISIHGGVYGRTVTKTKFSRIDGLPYFLNCGAPRARAFGSRGAPLQGDKVIMKEF